MPIPQCRVQLPWKAMVLLSLVWGLTACGNETPKDSSENTGTPSGNTGNTPYTVNQITAGSYHNCALLHTKQVKCWGANNYGQLGLGDKNDRGDDWPRGVSEMGNHLPTVDLGTASDGTALRATTIAAGFSYSCALLHTKQVKCWGRNNYGQLGLGDKNDRGYAPSQMGNNLLTVDFGTASDGTALRATTIAVGFSYSCALLHTKQVKCWGRNHYGQLGLGDKNDRGYAPSQMGNNLLTVDFGTASDGTALRATTIAASDSHSCALLHTKQVKCWGRNSYGQLGLGNTTQQTAPANTPVSLGTASDGTALRATTIAASEGHSCALLHTKQVKCWGWNGFGLLGQLGLGVTDDRGDAGGEMGNNLPVVDLGSTNGTPLSATAITANYRHSCVLIHTKQVKCWGQNNDGRLGLGDKKHRGYAPSQMGNNLPTVDLGTASDGTALRATAIATGFAHSCALLHTKQVKCWGNSRAGQLGTETSNTRGDTVGEMGNNMPKVDFGTHVK